MPLRSTRCKRANTSRQTARAFAGGGTEEATEEAMQNECVGLCCRCCYSMLVHCMWCFLYCSGVVLYRVLIDIVKISIDANVNMKRTVQHSRKMIEREREQMNLRIFMSSS